jgi:ABC-type ATPase involved in cell division
MISNKTVRENLILLQSYFDDSLSLTLGEDAIKFCKIFNLQDKLDIRPGELRPVELRVAIAIRELTKSFDLLLLERPEDYFDHSRFDLFNEILKDTLEHGQAIVFSSNNQNFIDAFSNRKIRIAGGTLTKVPN